MEKEVTITESELMDYSKLSEYLSRSVNTLRQDVQHRRIPFLKIGRHVRFRRSDIDLWLGSKVQHVR